MTELPKRIWVHIDGYHCITWSNYEEGFNGVEYWRADTLHACMVAGSSLNHHLFEITNALLNNPEVTGREMADMLDDAQLALSKWDRFLDGKEE